MSWAGHKRKLLSFPSNSSPSVDNDAGYGPSLAHPPAADGQTPLPTWKNSSICTIPPYLLLATSVVAIARLGERFSLC
jgi:hypothetical protein